MQPSLALRAPSADSVSCKGRPCSKTTGRWAQKQPSFKECVTAHQSRAWAPKMDGAKPAPDMRADRWRDHGVWRRGVRVEVEALAPMDRVPSKILGVVAAKAGENPVRR